MGVTLKALLANLERDKHITHEECLALRAALKEREAYQAALKDIMGWLDTGAALNDILSALLKEWA